MSDFPRTLVEDVSLPRLIIGTNWFLGFSHVSKAKDKFISEEIGCTGSSAKPRSR
jgi:hypothetical protein